MPSPEFVFRATSTLALMGWVLLLLSPPGARWSATARRLAGRVLPLAMSLVYVVVLASAWPWQGGFGSLAEVQVLFSQPQALVAGWVHYLAFDLFVGSWIAERGAALGLPHWQLVLLLLLTFLFGPAGLLGFVLLRALRRPRSLSLQPGVPA